MRGCTKLERVRIVLAAAPREIRAFDAREFQALLGVYGRFRLGSLRKLTSLTTQALPRSALLPARHEPDHTYPALNNHGALDAWSPPRSPATSLDVSLPDSLESLEIVVHGRLSQNYADELLSDPIASRLKSFTAQGCTGKYQASKARDQGSVAVAVEQEGEAESQTQWD